MDLQEYLKLIPAQHRQRPRYMATVQGLVKPYCDLEDVIEQMRAAFDLDRARGRQLDGVGERAGRNRELSVALEGVYFALDADKVGLDEGVWRGEYDPATGLLSLPDDVYRTLLRAKIAANAWDGTTPGAYAVWETAFAGNGAYILIQDNQDMSIVIGIAGIRLDAAFEQLLLQNYLPLKPEGVRVSWYAISEVAGPLFALDADSPPLGGLDRGTWPKEIIPQQ